MELIIISSEKIDKNEAAIINALFNAGMSRFHLRKPGSAKDDICLLLDKIDPAFRDRIALHQFHELAAGYGITRLHFTEQCRRQTTQKMFESFLMRGLILSTSVHNALHIPSLDAFQYVFFGPVFNSLSKPGYNSMVAPEFHLSKVTEEPKVIALGGIEPHRIATAREMGFDGVAALGAIWNNPEQAISNFEKLHACTQHLKLLA